MRYSLQARQRNELWRQIAAGEDLQALDTLAFSIFAKNTYQSVRIWDVLRGRVAEVHYDNKTHTCEWAKPLTSNAGPGLPPKRFEASSFNNRTGLYHRTYHTHRDSAERRLAGCAAHSDHKIIDLEAEA